jgi:cell wall-associated NlpC family hydrolase
MSFSGLGTGGIFSGAEAVTSITDTTVNNINLKPGDLLGWTVGGEETSGHVVIYIGNGEVSESHGHSGVGTATDISNRHISNYLSRIKFIKRAP